MAACQTLHGYMSWLPVRPFMARQKKLKPESDVGEWE